MSTRDLIDAIQSGDSVAVQSAFEASMATRVAARLDTMRQEVAQNMFKEHTELAEETYASVAKKAYAASHAAEDHLDSMDYDKPSHVKKGIHLARKAVDLHKKALNHPNRPEKEGNQSTKDIHNTHIDHLSGEADSLHESANLGEDMSKVGDNHLHVQEVKHEGKTKYKVHAVGKNFSDGIKVGEHLSDSELDDFQEMGGKIKHVK